uniref:Uncharacterized protein n=1 Tax=Corynebacterium phage HS01 TaxID=3056389 RepID=A0AA50AEH3_9VIRU|nr:MAG: hypothetical protein [Corynebacterium phage HS01]
MKAWVAPPLARACTRPPIRHKCGPLRIGSVGADR